MYSICLYGSSDKMGDLICQHYNVLFLINILKIPFGFGDKTIEQVCKDNNIDANTFLYLANMFLNGEEYAAELNLEKTPLSISTLSTYIKNSHRYFLEYRLPTIKSKLLEVLKDTNSKIKDSIISYYEEYENEVKEHMDYEEDVVFPYVESLIFGKMSKSNGDYSIDVFSQHHSDVEEKLYELKNIIIRYYNLGASRLLSEVMCDIFNCAKDLSLHSSVENLLFIPAIRELELKNER